MTRATSRFFVLAVISLTLSACDDKPATPGVGAASMPQRPPAPVQVAKAITKTVPIYIDEIGTCSPREFVQIRPQVAGKIMELHFTDGADIKKGQLLFTIDSRPYQAALDQAKASLAQAMASKSLATQQLENAQAAINAHAIAREELENRQNAVTIADAEIRVRQAAIETAQVNVDYCTITSPIDGRAGQRMIDVGNVVKANDDNPLLTIQRMDPIYADFITSERNLDEVRRQSDHGVLKTLVWSPQQSESQARQGELTFLDSTVQTGTGTIKLRATLPNKDRLFWPGEFVRIRLVLAEQPNAVLIPVVAQQVGQQGPFVYVAKPGPPSPDGKPSTIAELRPITLGQRQGDMIVVDKGLAAGEQVVTVGQMMIMPGGPVQIVPSTPPAMPTTSPTSQPASH